MGLMNKNIVIVFIGIFVMVVMVGGVRAGTCDVRQYSSSSPNIDTASEVIVLELSGLTNAHAIKVSSNNPQNGKFYVVCDKADVGSTVDYTCKPDQANEILRLYSSSNSHAWIPHGATTYTTQVCYGDLYCTWVQNPGSQFDINLLSMSDNSNAHLGSFSSYPETTPGNYQIRCDNIATGPCSNECTTAPDPICDDINTVRTYVCSDSDTTDICLESTSSTSTCSGGTQCDDGECKTFCQNGIKESLGADGSIGGGDDEECDDGNTIPGDGCENDCSETQNWICEEVLTNPSQCFTMYWEDASGYTITESDVDQPVKLVVKGSLLSLYPLGFNYEIKEIDSNSDTSSEGNSLNPQESGSMTVTINGANSIAKKDFTPTIEEFFIFRIWGADPLNVPRFSNQVSGTEGILTVTDTAIPGGDECEADLGGVLCDFPPNTCNSPISGASDETSIKLCCTSCSSTPIPSDCDYDGTPDSVNGEQCDFGSQTDTIWNDAHCIKDTCLCDTVNGYNSDGFGNCVTVMPCNDPRRLNTQCGGFPQSTRVEILGNGCKYRLTDECRDSGSVCAYLPAVSNPQEILPPSEQPPTCNPLDPTVDYASCVWIETVEGSCENGDEEVRFKYSSTEPDCNANHPPDQVRVCPRRVKIPGFNYQNVAIAIGLIILIYIVIEIIKKRKKISQKIKSVHLRKK